jgi:hypothetical protein
VNFDSTSGDYLINRAKLLNFPSDLCQLVLGNVGLDFDIKENIVDLVILPASVPPMGKIIAALDS